MLTCISKVTPAMAANLAEKVITLEKVCSLVPEPADKKREKYKNKI
jgi:hypothetical protein